MASFDSLLSQFKRNHYAPNPDAHDSNQSKKRLKRNNDDGAADDGAAPINPVTNIYLLCPANVTTGGPEACHQLCQMMNQVLLDDDCNCDENEAQSSKKDTAYVMYVDFENHQLVPSKNPKIPCIYEKYGVVVAKSNTGFSASDLIVFPEIWTEHVLTFAPQAQKSIWWLSVDNNKGQYFAASCTTNASRDNNIRHFYQSEYARDYLLKNGIPTKMLTKLFEYIPKERFVLSSPDDDGSFANHARYDANTRDLDVVYNPAKGKHFTDEIIEQSKLMDSGVRFTAISGENGERLTPDEVSFVVYHSAQTLSIIIFAGRKFSN